PFRLVRMTAPMMYAGGMRYLIGLIAALAISCAEARDCGLYQYRAVITDVYDGDTVTADIDLGFRTWRHGERLRLYGIDAPEMRGADKAAGTAARDALRSMVLGKEVIVCTIEDRTGKYGRYLARIFV